jgi:hypothetical protein
MKTTPNQYVNSFLTFDQARKRYADMAQIHRAQRETDLADTLQGIADTWERRALQVLVNAGDYALAQLEDGAA